MIHRSAARACVFSCLVGAVCTALMAGLTGVAFGQNGSNDNIFLGNVRQVGGVLVDANGVLQNVENDMQNQLRKVRQAALQEVPAHAEQAARLRMVSLRKLEQAIQAKLDASEPLPDEIKYLSGLQKVEYVLVLPEQNDIVIAGPGEGWTIDRRGDVVGVTTGLPVLHLDDLLVGLRVADAARNGGLSCSIDPTPEGIQRYQALMAKQPSISPQLMSAIEQAFGQQQITVTGVADTTRFANVMIAADYRMKRIAMNFDQSPIRELPNYLAMAPARAGKSEMPRWWLAPKYDPLLKDAEGLTWQIRGSGVKCMCEHEISTLDGSTEKTGRTNTPAHRWADLMTKHYNALAEEEPIFADLRNCIDLAIVGALVQQHDLATKANFPMSLLMDSSRLAVEEYVAPKQVATKTSVLKKGNNWIVTASGGVQFQPWELIQEPKSSNDLVAVRVKAEATGDHWWWNSN